MASFPEEPKPGDLIEIYRIGYSHWALYVGDGYVIHLAPPEDVTEQGVLRGFPEHPPRSSSPRSHITESLTQTHTSTWNLDGRRDSRSRMTASQRSRQAPHCVSSMRERCWDETAHWEHRGWCPAEQWHPHLGQQAFAFSLDRNRLTIRRICLSLTRFYTLSPTLTEWKTVRMDGK
ncbi:uncharacterized protein LOC102439222 isoform X1 [Myotis lucifugus]|uniref:uncharacterized protein LOC102439222 isoform X1 n=1 Tax=Myotis lucifugus TaxID=59463 RepID=UPI000CCC9EB5|nr:uncharacterized protein LOC102439222 isoform X1 [Myotis lucifugus]